LGLGTLLGIILLTELLIRLSVISRFVIPPPSEIAMSFGRVITQEDVVGRFFITMGETVAAGALLTVVGVPLGVALHRFAVLRQATETWIAAYAAAPVVLAYPLFLVICGRNSWTIIVMAFLNGLAPVILKTLEGLSAIKPVLLNLGRSYRMTPWQQFWRLLFPAALPAIFTGLRLGLIFAMISIVGVEFLINLGGLGPLINTLSERYDMPGTYAAICFVVLVSIIFFVLLERIERWLQPRR
jgi:ABC-type nitrate/sulfonate/bicarbonate transport system permease component